MLRNTLEWLDDRTGYHDLMAPIRRRVLPNGPSWWYTSATCLLWLFVVQMITGLLLMATYSPSTGGAWASIHFIEQSMAGSFLRGVHYFASHAMIVLFAVHIVRVLLSAAFRAPRELIWITGLLLMPLFLVWAVTGNPLSASQKAIAQIEVEGHIVGSTPLIGPIVQRLLIGGDEVGQLTFTHLYALHVGLLPLLVIVLLAIHISQVYRHGLFPGSQATSDHRARPYWPYQTVRNMTVLGILVAGISWLAWRYGAPLESPPDPSLHYMPRPEWYFRSLFELRRYFTGDTEFIATIVIPTVTLLVLLSIPMLDRRCWPKVSFGFRLLFAVIGLGGWAVLTFQSYARDWQDAEYVAAEEEAKELAARARALADKFRVPPEGPSALLSNDPKLQGPHLFRKHCANCHSYTDADGAGIAASELSAPNLHGFASPDWIAGMLDPQRINSEHYFGNTAFADGEMASTIVDMFDGLEGEDLKELQTQLSNVSQVLADEAQREVSEADEEAVASNAELLTELACTDCHRYHEEGDLGSAPDLTGYGSRKWLIEMIANPSGERFYPDDRNDRMPAFAENPHQPEANLISQRELELLVDWLRGEWYEP